MKAKLIGLGLITALGIATGCASSGTVCIRYTQGAACESLVDDSEETLRIMVAKPMVHGNLGDQDAEYWAKRVQNELKSKLRDAAARARRTKVEIVSSGDDMGELLRQQDLRAAGIVKTDQPRSGGIADYDVYIAGSIMIHVREECIRRSVYRPRIQGFSLWSLLFGLGNHDDVLVPVRITSVDATLEMVTNAGTRPVTFVTEEIKPVITEGGTGGVQLPGMKSEPLPALDADIRIALDRVAPAYVDLLYPREKRETVTVESCGNEECRKCVDEFLADAADGTTESDTLRSLEVLGARHGNCEDLRFCLAIAYELTTRFDDALDACHEAIRIADIDEPGDGARQSTRSAWAAHPYIRAQARLESRKRFDELRSELEDSRRPEESEARKTPGTERDAGGVARR